VLTQIYECLEPAEAAAVGEIGVDHVGAKLGPGDRPRELTVEAAKKIASALPASAKFSALFLGADAGLANGPGRVLGVLGGVAVMDDDVIAGLGGAQRQGAPDTARGAGDQGCAPAGHQSTRPNSKRFSAAKAMMKSAMTPSASMGRFLKLRSLRL